MIAYQSKTSIMARDQMNRNSPAVEDTDAKEKYKVRKYERRLLRCSKLPRNRSRNFFPTPFQIATHRGISLRCQAKWKRLFAAGCIKVYLAVVSANRSNSISLVSNCTARHLKHRLKHRRHISSNLPGKQ